MTHTAHLQLTWVSDDGLRIEGDLDYDTADELLDCVDRWLPRAHPDGNLVLDCAKVGFCDSYGLSTLLMIRRRLHGAGVHLHLDNRSPSLERLLTLTHTLKHLTEAPGA